MKSIKKNSAPHIEPGTHFNLARFKELYSWINALQMDSIAICHTPYQSGLLYFDNLVKIKEPLKIVGYELQVVQCCGVTKNGGIIGIFKDDSYSSLEAYDFSQHIEDGIYEILIGVDHVNRTAKGEASEDEVPYRQPFSDPSYKWDVFPKGEKVSKNFPNALKIGELSKEGDTLNLLDFIPSCKHVGGHPQLADKFLDYKKQFKTLLAYLEKVSHLAAQENDPDIENLSELARWLGHFIASERKVFDQGMQTSVFALFEFCKSFSSVLHFHFQSLTRGTQLLRMIEHNVEGSVQETFKEQDFRKVVENLKNEEYDHFNINNNLDTIDEFIEIIINRGFKLLGQRDKLFPLNTGIHMQNPVSKQDSHKNKKGSGFF